MARLNAATLVETLVASAVFMALFLAMHLILYNIHKSAVSLSQIRSKELIEQYIVKMTAKESNGLASFDDQIGDLVIKGSLIEVINSRAVRFSFVVLNKSGRIVEEQQRILLIR